MTKLETIINKAIIVINSIKDEVSFEVIDTQLNDLENEIGNLNDYITSDKRVIVAYVKKIQNLTLEEDLVSA
jgi:hypothetical protein